MGCVCVLRCVCVVGCVGACVAWGRGCGGEKVSLAALLSGYLGKSGHLPRFRLHLPYKTRYGTRSFYYSILEKLNVLIQL